MRSDEPEHRLRLAAGHGLDRGPQGQAVVVRRPDARWGEVPVAFVASSDVAPDAAALIAQCRGRMAGYKLPKDVVFIAFDDFPRSATGKVKRHELEARLPGRGLFQAPFSGARGSGPPAPPTGPRG